MAIGGSAKDHLCEVVRQVGRLQEVLHEARNLRMSVELDIAIEPEDRKNLGYSSVTCDLTLLRTLADEQVTLTITAY